MKTNAQYANLDHLSDEDNDICECSDYGCDSCFGTCQNKATTTLYRIDMQDESGTRFCDDCASDALDSGVFSEEEQDIRTCWMCESSHEIWDSGLCMDCWNWFEDNLPGDTTQKAAEFAYENQFKISENGTIKNLGKFENEALYVPYFWDVILNGFGDEDEDGNTCIPIEAEDVEIFPELAGYESIILHEDDNGFVYGNLW